MKQGTGASGVGGLPGRIADAWDSLPVKGVVAALVVAGGTLAALAHGGPEECDTNPLVHVYRPQRLQIVEKCATVTGTVMAYRHEHDGDYHVGMKMDDGSWTNLKNVERQHGLTVVEFVPLLPAPGTGGAIAKQPKFFVGQRLQLKGTKVLDKQHGGWVEMHPVFEAQDVTPAEAPGRTPQPNRPTLAPPTEE